MDKTELENNIGYVFNDKELLNRALSHTSYAYEHNLQSNEKLEFLGDSILEYVSSEYIYNTYPDLKEGEMTKVRATVVCEESLYRVAKNHNFSDFLNLGKSEKVTCKQGRPAILADSVEAVIAAMYLDGGIEPAKKFIVENLKEDIEIAVHHVGEKDYKTVLQELLQVNGNVKIEYNILRELGPDHAKRFEVEVRCNNNKLAVRNREKQKVGRNGSGKKCY